MGVTLLMIWVLQLFPATPKLAPVFNAVTHMTPPPVPLLLVVPAAALDLLMRRFGAERDWQLSVFVGVAFLAVFLATQWFFADFLLSPYARNYFFGADQWDYSSQLGPWRYRYWRLQTDPITPAALAIAALFAIAAARVGLWWGNWMARVKRGRAARSSLPASSSRRRRTGGARTPTSKARRAPPPRGAPFPTPARCPGPRTSPG